MIEKMNFDKEGGLIPAIIQDAISGQVLMLAYMNQEALAKPETGKTRFYPRSRKSYWMKGESSGHVQTVKEILSTVTRLPINQSGAERSSLPYWPLFLFLQEF